MDHALGLMHRLTFDSNEQFPLPYAESNLHCVCMGEQEALPTVGPILEIMPVKCLIKENIRIMKGGN